MKSYSKDNLYKILINLFKLKGILVKRSEHQISGGTFMFLNDDNISIVVEQAATRTNRTEFVIVTVEDQRYNG